MLAQMIHTTTEVAVSGAFMRTPEGCAELHAHAAPLSRPARNLLHVINPARSGIEWVHSVRGAAVEDLVWLVRTGLVTAAAEPPGTMPLAPPNNPNDGYALWDYDALYALLTSEARDRFGLLKGTWLVLGIERCRTLGELQSVAMRFVEHVARAFGDDAAGRLRRRLDRGACVGC
jgi:hypothetical protein